jgi:hypothetical protein
MERNIFLLNFPKFHTSRLPTFRLPEGVFLGNQKVALPSDHQGFNCPTPLQIEGQSLFSRLESDPYEYIDCFNPHFQ